MSAINHLIQFGLAGPMAHFKKYYSNKSSLTYAVPPRTVVAGIIASMLEWSRDTYYEVLGPENCKLGVGLNCRTRKLVQCMNYLEKSGGHTQVRLQLLLPLGSALRYTVYFAHQNPEVYGEVREALEHRKQGFGLYLGQRPFRAHLTDWEECPASEISVRENYSGGLSTATYQENVQGLERSADVEVTAVSMPVNMRRVEDGREPVQMGTITFERNGAPLRGTFKQVLEVEDRAISFFTPM